MWTFTLNKRYIQKYFIHFYYTLLYFSLYFFFQIRHIHKYFYTFLNNYVLLKLQLIRTFKTGVNLYNNSPHKFF